MVPQSLLYVPHYSVVKPSFSAKLNTPILEAVINIQTGKSCAHGKCNFCSLGNAEREKTTMPLTDAELHSQLQKGLRGIENAKKLSIVSNCHSTITSEVVSESALIPVISFAAENGIQELSFETRMDVFLMPEMQRILSRLAHVARSFNLPVEITCGIETPYEHERNAVMNKGLTDDQIRKAAKEIFSYGFSLRAYHIFLPPTVEFKGEETHMQEFAKLKKMLDFLNDLRTHEGNAIHLWVIPGYSSDNSAAFTPPDLAKVGNAMNLASFTAIARDIPMYLVEEDIGMIQSDTTRIPEPSLIDKLRKQNQVGWLR
jgi:hypothetical protein